MSSAGPVTIERVIDSVPVWRGRSVSFAPLPGGLTNRNYLVTVEDELYVARIPGETSDLLAIDRWNEYCNSQSAALTGVAPRIAHYLADMRVMVLEYINSETMTIPRLQKPGIPSRIAESLRRLHASPRFHLDFNMFRLMETYLEICRQNDVAIPEDYRSCFDVVARIEVALARRPLRPAPCHNDLLAGNYLDDGQKIWLIDFEYSGNNDPCFELGNTCQENLFDDERQAELCAAYFGDDDPAKLARMRLYMLMSDIGWTLWGSIQTKASSIDFDFWGWTMEKWNRATTRLKSPELSKDLALV